MRDVAQSCFHMPPLFIRRRPRTVPAALPCSPVTAMILPATGAPPPSSSASARAAPNKDLGNHYGKRGSRCQHRGYLFDVHGDSPKDSSQRDKRTGKRTISAEKRSSKLQSTADCVNPPVRRAMPWFAAPLVACKNPGRSSGDSWSALWTILRTAQTGQPFAASRRTGSIRGRKSPHI